MLKYIVIVTLLVQHLGAIEEPYREYLAYAPVHRGVVTTEQAGVWGAPAMAGRPLLILQPASHQPVYLRFIESAAGAAATFPQPGKTFGWNATEILVQDPDALARRLEQSPFVIVGQPRDLYPAPDAPRAMQVLGPAGELLYFTRVIPSGFRLPMAPARTPVDRVFIVVAGGPSMAVLRDYYSRSLGLPVSAPAAFRISAISRANGLPAESTFPLATAPLPTDYLVELDEYPSAAAERNIPAGSLPPGMAMVSFATEGLEHLHVRWRAAPATIQEFPYNGHETAVTVGPAGEWIEVIASAPGR